MQPIEVQNVIVIVLMFLDRVQQSRTQDVMIPALPLGQFRFITISPFGFDPMSSSTNQFPQSSAVLDRPQIDRSVPAGVDAANIAAQGDAIVAFINACPRQMSLAYLRCPCSNPEGRCADAYSVCSVDHKCVCNGRLSYPDPSGQRCIPYVTSTTRLPTTRTTTPTPTTMRTTRTTTPTTTTTATTTKTGTTTTKPPMIYTGCARIGVETFQTLAISDTVELISEPSLITSSLCIYHLIPPPGKRLQLVIEALHIPSTFPTVCSSSVTINGSGDQVLETTQLCNTFTPLPTYTFPANQEAKITVDISQGSANTTPHIYKLKFSVV